MQKKLLNLLLIIMIPVLIAAQDTASIKTDRPDQTDGTEIIGKGKLQVETELYYNWFKEGRAAIISSTLIRHGVTKNIELRLLAEDGRERDRFIEETAQGLYPLAMGTKIAIIQNKKSIPDVSLINYIKLPFTSKTNSKIITGLQHLSCLWKKI